MAVLDMFNVSNGVQELGSIQRELGKVLLCKSSLGQTALRRVKLPPAELKLNSDWLQLNLKLTGLLRRIQLSDVPSGAGSPYCSDGF